MVAFTGSKCKKEAASALHSTLTRGLVTGVDGTEYEGLQCVAWDVSVQGKFDLLNFASACGPDWVGSASRADDGGITLAVNNPSCAVAGCGSCIYDWSFTVDRVAADGDIALDIDVIVCDKAGETSNNQTFALSIPAAASAKGVTCRYAEYGALQWQAFALGTMGRLNMPCVDPADYPGEGEPPPCEDGLACTKMQPGTHRDAAICLKSCAADADCPLPELSSCQDGVCRLKAQW